MTFEMVTTDTLADVDEAICHRPADVVFCDGLLKEDPDDVTDLFRRVAQREGRPTIIFLDYYAPGVVALFRRASLRRCLLQAADAPRPFALFGTSTGRKPVHRIRLGKRWASSSTVGISPSVADPDTSTSSSRLELGVTPHYRISWKLTAAMPMTWDNRPFSINCRMGLSTGHRPKTEWYHEYRERWVDALGPLRLEYRCTGSQRIRLPVLSRRDDLEQDWRPVRSAGVRSVYRDYEVIGLGCSPDQTLDGALEDQPEHLPGWQDLRGGLLGWEPMSRRSAGTTWPIPRRPRKIIHNGRAVLTNYFENDGFVRMSSGS